MSYTVNIPTANQTIASTQAPINANFTVNNTAFGVDHTPLVQNTNQGFHNRVTLVNRAVASLSPINPAPINQGPILFSTTSTAGGYEIFYRQANNDGGNVIQLTSGFTSLPVANATNGTTFLPGPVAAGITNGIILKWGKITITNTNSGPVTYTTAFPNATLTPQATLNAGTGVNFSVAINNLSNMGFTINVNPTVSGSLTIFWTAIGF